MSWESKFQEFGVIKVEGNNVKVYSNSQFYLTIHVGEPLNDARWAGDAVVVNLKSGKARRYTSSQFYITV